MNAALRSRVADSSDALHRAFADAGAICVLVIDPSTRAWDAAHVLQDALRHLPAERSRTLASPHPGLDASYLPRMYELDPASSQDSAAIHASIVQADAELEDLSRGGGRSVCMWLSIARPLEARSHMQELAAAFAAQLVHRRPGAGLELLRWYDPAVLWLLWPRLSTEQRAGSFVGVHGAYLLDPDGHLGQIGAGPGATGTLRLGAEQWIDIDLISAVNVALQDLESQEVQRAKLGPAALPALRRAHNLGFTDKADLAAFAMHAMTVSPEFDRHAIVRSRLVARQPGEYYTALVDDLTPETWQAIARNTATSGAHSTGSHSIEPS